MQDIPDRLTLKRHRDLEGTSTVPWPRRIILSLIALFSILGLLNAFGQRPQTTLASAPAARLKLYAPAHLRGGLLFSARFHVYADRDIKNAFLILDTGWVEGMSVNTIEPSPLGQASANGRLSLQLGHIPKGESSILWMELQVNPTTVGHHAQTVRLYDGKKLLVTVRRSVFVFP